MHNGAPQTSSKGRSGNSRSKAFSGEVGTGSRRENASNQASRDPFQFNRNGNGSRVFWIRSDLRDRRLARRFSRGRLDFSSPSLPRLDNDRGDDGLYGLRSLGGQAGWGPSASFRRNDGQGSKAYRFRESGNRRD